jgi:hypothetical protein
VPHGEGSAELATLGEVAVEGFLDGGGVHGLGGGEVEGGFTGGDGGLRLE